MAPAENESFQSKISAEFDSRLRRLAPDQKVRAIALLDVLPAGSAGLPPGGRRSRTDRLALIDAVRESAKPALEDIDRVLARVGGRRLSSTVDALGTVPVEATAAGIRALAASAHVKAILEDQPISLVV
jgi:hypothetical protein